MFLPKWNRRQSGLLTPWRPLSFASSAPFHFSPCPECCTCTLCSEETPATWQVVLSSMADGTCADCDENFNDTFILTRTHQFFTPLGAITPKCVWTYNLGEKSICTYDYLALWIIPTGPVWTLVVGFISGIPPGSFETYFFASSPTITTDPSRTDCTTVANASLGGATDTQCDGTGATCLVTAL